MAMVSTSGSMGMSMRGNGSTDIDMAMVCAASLLATNMMGSGKRI